MTPNYLTMTLTDYFPTYSRAKFAEGISSKAITDVGRSIKWLESFLEHPPTLSELSDANLSALQVYIVKHDRTPRTAVWVCERLLVLWRFAVWRGDIPSGGKQPKVKALKFAHSPKKKKPGTVSDRRPVLRIPSGHRKQPERPTPIPKPPASKATRKTTLEDFLFKHYVPARDLGQRTIESYSSVIAHFCRYLGRPATIDDLTAESINGFLSHLLTLVSKVSASGHRTVLLLYWRYAYEVGILDESPRRVRPIKKPERVIEGYDAQQMAQLFAAADKLRGTSRTTGIPQRIWWRGFIMLAWFSGLRFSDLIALTKDQIRVLPDGSGEFTVAMQKTGKTIRRIIPPEAMHEVDACLASGKPRKACFPLWGCRRDFFRDFKLLAQLAELPVASSFRWVRRGSASEVERLVPGGGRTHLGHKSVGLFESAYRVDRIVGQKINLPPSIGFDADRKDDTQ